MRISGEQNGAGLRQHSNHPCRLSAATSADWVYPVDQSAPPTTDNRARFPLAIAQAYSAAAARSSTQADRARGQRHQPWDRTPAPVRHRAGASLHQFGGRFITPCRYHPAQLEQPSWPADLVEPHHQLLHLTPCAQTFGRGIRGRGRDNESAIASDAAHGKHIRQFVRLHGGH